MLRALLTFVLLSLVGVSSHAAIHVAQSGSATGTLPTNAVQATGINITEASNQTLYVAFFYDTTTAQNPTATFNFDSLTQLPNNGETTGTGRYLWVGYLTNPDSGSAMNLVFSGLATNVDWRIIWVVVNDNDQTTPFDSAGVQLTESASTTTISATTSSQTDDLVLAFAAFNNRTVSSVGPTGAGQVEILETNNNGAVYAGASYTPGGASITTTWTALGADIASQIALNLNARVAFVEPARFSLELVSPRQTGTSPSVGAPAIPSGHAALHAYPGIQYEYTAVGIGGAKPYTWNLEGSVPSGMTIDATTGRITWANPDASASPTIRLTDASGESLTSTFTINVSTSGFKFANSATGNDSWNCTVPAFVSGTTGPCATLDRIKDVGAASDIVYLDGTFDHNGMTRTGEHPFVSSSVDATAFTPTNTQFETIATTDLAGAVVYWLTGPNAGVPHLVRVSSVVNGRGHHTLHASAVTAPTHSDTFVSDAAAAHVPWSAASDDPVRFRKHPDAATATIDGGWVSHTQDWGAYTHLAGNGTYPVYLDGLKFQNSPITAIRFAGGSNYRQFSNLEITGVRYDADGANPASIMNTEAGVSTPNWYVTTQGSYWHDNEVGDEKAYSIKNGLWERNRYWGNKVGPDIKGANPRIEVRYNWIKDKTGPHGLFGNMNDNNNGAGPRTTGEICFNLLDRRDAGSSWYALDLNQDGFAGEIHVYRNTILGRYRIRNVDSADGPFRSIRNVIINTDSSSTDRIKLESVTDSSRIIYGTGDDANLSGGAADNIVDADELDQGALIGTYLIDHGPNSAAPRGAIPNQLP